MPYLSSLDEEGKRALIHLIKNEQTRNVGLGQEADSYVISKEV